MHHAVTCLSALLASTGLLAAQLAPAPAAHASAPGSSPALTAVQEAELISFDPGTEDYFGWSCAVFHDTAVVGEVQDHNAAGLQAGAAFVYVRQGGAWVQQAKFMPSDLEAHDLFGTSVAIAGNTAAVVSLMDSVGSVVACGSVRIFVRSGTTWSEQATLVVDDPHDVANMGRIALSGNTLVWGAPDDDTLGNQAGAAYVFVRSGVHWTQQAKLLAPDGQDGDRFGSSVDVSGGNLIVGAPNESHFSFASEGAAYVYTRQGSDWSLQAKLVMPDPGFLGDEFGSSVSIWRGLAAVGAEEDFVGPSSTGSAFVFVRSGSTWTQQALLSASDKHGSDLFGNSISVLGDRLVVGAPHWHVPPPNGVANVGSAYVFQRDGEAWTEQAHLIAADKKASDEFGRTVDVWNDSVLCSSWLHDEPGHVNAGAVYAFHLESTFADLSGGLSGCLGEPSLIGTGTLAPGSIGALTISDAAPAATALLFVGLQSAQLPVKGGTLVPFPFVVMLPCATDAEGEVEIRWTEWPAGLPAGTEIFAQAVLLDADSPQGYAFTNALRAVTP